MFYPHHIFGGEFLIIVKQLNTDNRENKIHEYINELFQQLNGKIDLDFKTDKNADETLPIPDKLSICMGVAQWKPIRNEHTWNG